MIHADLDRSLRQLAAKYAVDVPEQWRLETTAEKAGEENVAILPGWALLDQAEGERSVPLLPWRSERRFVELKRLVDSHTIDPVVMCRFSCLTTGAPLGLRAILYREFDLLEWLAGAPIVTVCANTAAGRFTNVIARLENGVVSSIEAGVTLPAGSSPAVLDRHEMIARRGVASDRVVDTQVPQSSVYAFTEGETVEYTDTDAELFGLATDDVNLVRSAYELAIQPQRAEALRQQHRRLVEIVRLTEQSDRTRQRLAVKGGAR
jgi:hypothetical protein